ncbi:MAG TPA: hypothetical protein VIG36_11030, partial [Methylocystis sp.]
HTDIAGVFEGVATLFGAAATKKAELAATGRLTEAGIGAEVTAWAAKGVVPQLRRAEKFLADKKAVMDEYRASVGRPQIDRTDTLRAAHRKEAREYLRGLSVAQQAGLLLSPSADLLFAEAALEIPALSGAAPDLIEKARAVYAERIEPNIMAKVADREESIAALGAAVEITKANLRREVQPEGQSFDAWFDSVK